MKLDLERTRHGRSEFPVSGSLKLDWAEDRPGEASVQGVLVVQNLDSRFLLNGTLQARGRATCGRCLEEFELSWDVPVEIMVLRDVESDEGEGDSLVIRQADGEVDLAEALRESLILAFPPATVCRQDCRGICALCGADLNQGTCSCDAADEDPRWAALDAIGPDGQEDQEDQEDRG